MNWLNPRDELLHRCENFRDFGHYDKISRKNRGEILAENNYTCRYCGGVYPKYLMSVYIPHAKTSDVTCRMCYIITKLNYGHYNEIKIFYSLMSQLDIIKNTVNYLIDNNEMPKPNQIDKDVQTSPLSVLEYINLLNNYDVQPPELKNYKVFFSEKLNTDFIINNYSSKMPLFIDKNNNNNKVEENKEKQNIQSIKKHIPTKEELALFNKIYPNV